MKTWAISFGRRVEKHAVEAVPVWLGMCSVVAAIGMADRAPQSSAIIIGAGLIALAIYKRPAAHVETRFSVGDMQVEQIDGVLMDRELSIMMLKALAAQQEKRGDA